MQISILIKTKDVARFQNGWIFFFFLCFSLSIHIFYLHLNWTGRMIYNRIIKIVSTDIFKHSNNLNYQGGIYI